MLSSTQHDRADPLVLLTGAQGKVGRPMLEALLRQGYRVRALTSRPAHPIGGPRVDWVVRDLREDHDLREDVRGCTAILHLAGEQPHDGDLLRVNRDSTAMLARAAEIEGVRLMCFTSSISVHGSSVVPVVDEDSPLLTGDVDRPGEFLERSALRAYARSKVQAEQAIREVAERVQHVVVRPTVIVDQDDVLAALAMPPLQRAVAWRQRTHWIAVEDVVDALIRILQRGLDEQEPRNGVEVLILSDEATPHRYRDLFAAAGVPRGSFHGIPLPPVPATAWLAVKRLKQGRVRSWRRPFGLTAYPAERLIRSGWSPKVGVWTLVTRAVASACPDPVHPDERLAIGIGTDAAASPAHAQSRLGRSTAGTGRRAKTTRR